MSSFVFFTVKASGCKKLHSCYAGCYASHSFTLLTNSTNLYPSLLVCFLYHSTLLMRHKLLIQNFYLLPWHQFTPPHGCICVCNKYYIKYAFFLAVTWRVICWHLCPRSWQTWNSCRWCMYLSHNLEQNAHMPHHFPVYETNMDACSMCLYGSLM